MAKKSSGFKNVAGLLFEAIILLFIVACWSKADVGNQHAEKPTAFAAVEHVILHDGGLRIEGKATPLYLINSGYGVNSFFTSLKLPSAISKGLLINMFQCNAFYVFLTTSAP